MPKFNVQKVVQIGMVTKDAKQKLENFKALFNIDENSIQKMETKDLQYRPKYHQKDVKYDLLIYLFEMGGIQFELIQPLSESGDAYSDFLNERGEGIHHIFVALDDADGFVDIMKEKKIKQHTSGTMNMGEGVGDVDYIYFDLREELGLLFEMSTYKGPGNA